MGLPIVPKTMQDVSATESHPLWAKWGNQQCSEHWYLGVALGHLASTGHSDHWTGTWQCRRTCQLFRNSPYPLHLAGETMLSKWISFKSYCPPRIKFPGCWSAKPHEDLQLEALSWQHLPRDLAVKV